MKYVKSLGDLFPNMVMPDRWKRIEISTLTQDSRSVVSGSLFFAIDGVHEHGDKYIENAIGNGAAAIIVERKKETLAINKVKISYPNVAIFIDENLSASISEIAGHFYNNPSQAMSLIGVTGTNGKSSCVHLISELWKLQGKQSAQIGTLGFGLNAIDKKNSGFADTKLTSTGLTTPGAIQTQEILATLKSQKVSNVAMEVSSHGIHQNRVAGLKFDIAILTNITRDHLDYHKTFDEYARVKSTFVSDYGTNVSIVNIDDPFGRKLSKVWNSHSLLLTYSLYDSSAELYVVQKDFHVNGITARICSPWGTGVLRTSLLGEFNLSNLLASIAACCACGDNFQKVLRNISKIDAPAGRMQKVLRQPVNNIVSLESSKKVYVDFAHTPDALEKAIAALRKHCEKNIWLVFGCGGDRDVGKRAIMGGIAAQYADYVVITSDNPRTEDPIKILEDIAYGAKNILKNQCVSTKLENLPISRNIKNKDTKNNAEEPLHIIEDREQAIIFAITHAKVNDVVLIAGKGHESYQIVGDVSYPFSDYAVSLKSLDLCAKIDGGLNSDSV